MQHERRVIDVDLHLEEHTKMQRPEVIAVVLYTGCMVTSIICSETF